jgi:hypothetical protein
MPEIGRGIEGSLGERKNRFKISQSGSQALQILGVVIRHDVEVPCCA